MIARASASVRPSFFSSVWNFASLPENRSVLIDAICSLTCWSVTSIPSLFASSARAFSSTSSQMACALSCSYSRRALLRELLLLGHEPGARPRHLVHEA